MNPNRAFRRSENRKNSGKSVFFGALTFCLLALGFLTLFFGGMDFSARGAGSALSAQEAAVDLSQGPAQDTAQDSAAGADAFDVTIYASPIKMVQTQSSERILNSAEWTEFYLNLVGKFDETHLRKEPASPLMTQLDRTFGKSPCSSNDLLNLAFFNLQGIWLNLTLAPNLALEPSAPFLTLVSRMTRLRERRGKLPRRLRAVTIDSRRLWSCGKIRCLMFFTRPCTSLC